MCEHNTLKRIIVGETSNWKCEGCGDLFAIQPFIIGVDYGTGAVFSTGERELRIIEKRIGGEEWAVVRMHDLKQGDVFRFQDQPEEQWKASANPYVINREGKRTILRAATSEDPLVWAVDASPVNSDGSRRVTEFSTSFLTGEGGLREQRSG